MAVLNDTDIVSALKENAENGFRLLMAKYKEAVYWLSGNIMGVTGERQGGDK